MCLDVGRYGVDLGEASECRKVIESLERDVEAANAREREARRRLVELATSVMNLSPGLQVLARKELAGIRGSADVMGFLSEMARHAEGAEGLKDDELVSAVLEKVWGELDMSSEESALLCELVERFRKVRVEDGVNV